MKTSCCADEKLWFLKDTLLFSSVIHFLDFQIIESRYQLYASLNGDFTLNQSSNDYWDLLTGTLDTVQLTQFACCFKYNTLFSVRKEDGASTYGG